jgi:hypothetical protein
MSKVTIDCFIGGSLPKSTGGVERFKVRLSDLDWWKGFGRARLSLREIPV